MAYNLLTPYTSFIAVREKVVNPNGDADNVKQPLPMPEGVMDTAIGAEPDLWWLLAASGLAAAIIMLRRRIYFLHRLCSMVE